jgi:flagellar basal-body rod protein FlgF
MSSSGIYPALSGAVAESRALEVVASNLANASTSSFRAQRLGFREVLARSQGRGEQRFVQVADAVLDMTPGPVRFTGQSTDLALEGPGFLVVQTPAGQRFLRGGSLKRMPDGRLVTDAGQELIGVVGGNDRPIRLPAGEPLLFGRRGEVMIDQKQVGQLKMVEFQRPQTMRGEGGGLFAPAAGDTSQAATRTEVTAQHLEGANVNPLRAMTEIIVTSRHYEALHRAIETYRELDTEAARELARVN